MSIVSIVLEDRSDERRFDTALTSAGDVARDMILVRTSLRGDAVVKVVQTNCAKALAIFEAWPGLRTSHA